MKFSGLFDQQQKQQQQQQKKKKTAIKNCEMAGSPGKNVNELIHYL